MIFQFPAEYNYITLLIDQDRWSEAQTALEQFLEKHPENLWGRVQLGVTLLAKQELDWAEEVINSLLGDHGDHVSVNILASRLAMQQEDFERARRFGRVAVQIDPEFVPALNGLAEVLFRWSQFREADELVDLALELEPENLTALSFKIYLLTELDLEGGDELIQRALAVDPMNVGAIVLDGKRLLKDGQVRDATKRLEEAVALNPRNGFARKALLNVYRSSILFFPFYQGEEEAGGKLGKSLKFLLYVLFLSIVCLPALLWCLVESLHSEQRILYALLSYFLVVFILNRPLARAVINVVLLRKAQVRILMNSTVSFACQAAVGLMLLSLIPLGVFFFYPELIYIRLYIGLLLVAVLAESAFYSPFVKMRVVFGGLGIVTLSLLAWAVISFDPLAIVIASCTFGFLQLYIIKNRVESTAPA